MPMAMWGQVDHLLGHPEEPMSAQHHALQGAGGGQTQDRSRTFVGGKQGKQLWMLWMMWLGCSGCDLDVMVLWSFLVPRTYLSLF
jgi:hypothetical protein